MEKQFHYIVTSGKKYIDIDALACGIVLSKLLVLKGYHSTAVFNAPFNDTITPTIRNWPLAFESDVSQKSAEDRYILVDVSDPVHFDSCVELEKVTGVFDHHVGFEGYWQSRNEVRTVIEPIGACATLIWREFIQSGMVAKIATTEANLLSTAILSNSLCFQSLLTTEEDKIAYQMLQEFTDLPNGWTEMYFSEQDAIKSQNAYSSLLLDTKALQLNEKKLHIGQLELWNATPFLASANFKESLKNYFALQSKEGPSLVNMVSVGEGIGYVYSDCKQTLDGVSKLFPQISEKLGPLLVKLNKPVLRKDILAGLLAHS